MIGVSFLLRLLFLFNEEQAVFFSLAGQEEPHEDEGCP
jgi:hypothetical protein